MKDNTTLIVSKYNTPCGPNLLLGACDDKIWLCDWLLSDRCARTAKRLDVQLREGTTPILELARRQLDEYFSGQRHEFCLPLNIKGTEFQCRVWNALLTIPYGTTTSYSHIAQLLSSKNAVRATANAIGANPMSIIVPCHRVIGSNGHLTGYAGGIETKRALLAIEHEHRHAMAATE